MYSSYNGDNQTLCYYHVSFESINLISLIGVVILCKIVHLSQSSFNIYSYYCLVVFVGLIDFDSG